MPHPENFVDSNLAFTLTTFFSEVSIYSRMKTSCPSLSDQQVVQLETSPSRFDPEGKHTCNHSVLILAHISRILCLIINLKLIMKV